MHLKDFGWWHVVDWLRKDMLTVWRLMKIVPGAISDMPRCMACCRSILVLYVSIGWYTLLDEKCHIWHFSVSPCHQLRHQLQPMSPFMSQMCHNSCHLLFHCYLECHWSCHLCHQQYHRLDYLSPPMSQVWSFVLRIKYCVTSGVTPKYMAQTLSQSEIGVTKYVTPSPNLNLLFLRIKL